MKPAISAIIIFAFLISCGNKNVDYKDLENQLISVVKDTIIAGVDMVFVPSGPYKSGLDCETRNIAYGYWIGKYEITTEQFYHFLKVGLDSNFLHLENSELLYQFEGDSMIPQGDYHVKVFDKRVFLKNGSIQMDSAFAKHPIISVTWYGAKAFSDFYGFDLPLESEWEKAARGNACTRFPWGNGMNETHANYYRSNDPFEPATTPVGFYDGQLHAGFQTSNAVSPFGCYDLIGNSWEWVSDVWDAETPYHKGKGGGYHYHTPAQMQIYYVSTYGPSERPPLDMCDTPDGFRVVYKLRK